MNKIKDFIIKLKLRIAYEILDPLRNKLAYKEILRTYGENCKILGSEWDAIRDSKFKKLYAYLTR